MKIGNEIILAFAIILSIVLLAICGLRYRMINDEERYFDWLDKRCYSWQLPIMGCSSSTYPRPPFIVVHVDQNGSLFEFKNKKLIDFDKNEALNEKCLIPNKIPKSVIVLSHPDSLFNYAREIFEYANDNDLEVIFIGGDGKNIAYIHSWMILASNSTMEFHDYKTVDMMIHDTYVDIDGEIFNTTSEVGKRFCEAEKEIVLVKISDSCITQRVLLYLSYIDIPYKIVFN